MTALLSIPQREKADAVHLIIRPVTIMLARHRHDDGRGSFRSRTGHGGQGIIFMDRLWRAKGSLPRGQVTQKPVLGRAAKSRIKILAAARYGKMNPQKRPRQRSDRRTPAQVTDGPRRIPLGLRP